MNSKGMRIFAYAVIAGTAAIALLVYVTAIAILIKYLLLGG